MFADKAKIRQESRNARHERIRKKISGTAERPRFCVRRSLNNMYAQIIDDKSGKSLLQISSLSADLREKGKEISKTEISKVLGTLIATKALAAGIENVVFDRGGYLFHGRVKAVAEAAREAGLKF